MFLRNKTLIATLALLITAPVQAIEEHLIVKRGLSFGNVVPRVSSCSLDPGTLAMTSPSNACIGSNHVAEIELHGDANTIMRIEFFTGTNAPNNITYYPKVRLTNNLGGDVTTTVGASIINFSTGSDGKLTMLIGGQINIGSALLPTTVYNVDYNIDYREQ